MTTVVPSQGPPKNEGGGGGGKSGGEARMGEGASTI